MTVTLFQVLVGAIVSTYLCCSVVAMRHRSSRSWNMLVARLRPGWNVRGLIEDRFADCSSISTPCRNWNQLHRTHGLWDMFANAGVMLEMADYAAQNSDTFDRDVLTSLRRDAMQIRVLVLEVLGRYVVGVVNESISMSILRVESAYAEMTLRITTVLEESAPETLPAFIGAI